VLAVLHLKVISAHIQEEIVALPLRCTYLRRALTGLQIYMFDSCSKISIHPLRDLNERRQGTKPTRRAISALRHNAPVASQGERERIPLTSHRVAVAVVVVDVVVVVCLYVSTSRSHHLRHLTHEIDDSAARSSACVGKEQGER
jgi:hypothetical protein